MNRTARAAFSSSVMALTAAIIVFTWPALESRPQANQQSAGPTKPMSMHTTVQMKMKMPIAPPAGPHGVPPPEEGPPLAPGAKHGLVHRLSQYPAIFLATAKQRAAAERLRGQLFAAAQRWAN